MTILLQKPEEIEDFFQFYQPQSPEFNQVDRLKDVIAEMRRISKQALADRKVESAHWELKGNNRPCVPDIAKGFDKHLTLCWTVRLTDQSEKIFFCSFKINEKEQIDGVSRICVF